MPQIFTNKLSETGFSGLKDLQDFLNHKLLNNEEEDLMLGGGTRQS
jgi:hypothetical protein